MLPIPKDRLRPHPAPSSKLLHATASGMAAPKLAPSTPGTLGAAGDAAASVASQPQEVLDTEVRKTLHTDNSRLLDTN